MIKPHNIYIHVPFCLSKCRYCAFFSAPCAKPDWDLFLKNILSEINRWANVLGKITVPTIFFGGGTPSLMPESVFSCIIENIEKNFFISKNCEITLEANPGTIEFDKLNNFKNLGVNRLSVGMQSFNDEKLKFLGRIHSAKQALDLLEFANKLNLRTSADFIYGLPEDTVQDVINLCKNINNIGLKHCSLYELTIEPDTPFGKMNLQMPSNEEMAEMYVAISQNLKLPRYEVSNYALPGNECRHNQNIWDGEPYIGIGKGAAGRILIDNQWYEQLGNNEKFEKITNETRAIEKLITGLRQVRGVKLDSDIKKVINLQFVNQNKNLLHITSDNRLAATEKGMLILDDLLLNLTR